MSQPLGGGSGFQKVSALTREQVAVVVITWCFTPSQPVHIIHDIVVHQGEGQVVAIEEEEEDEEEDEEENLVSPVPPILETNLVVPLHSLFFPFSFIQYNKYNTIIEHVHLFQQRITYTPHSVSELPDPRCDTGVIRCSSGNRRIHYTVLVSYLLQGAIQE